MDRITSVYLLAMLLLVACAEPPGSIHDSDLVAVAGKLDSWMAAENKTRQSPAAATPSTKSVAPVTDMLSGLEQRLQENPGDAKGWSLLAQSYAFVGRMDDAQSAADKAVALGADPDAIRSKVLSAHSGSTR